MKRTALALSFLGLALALPSRAELVTNDKIVGAFNSDSDVKKALSQLVASLKKEIPGCTARQTGSV